MFHILHCLQRQYHIVGKNSTIQNYHKWLHQWTRQVIVSHHFYPLPFMERFTCLAVTWTGNSVSHRSLASDSGSKPPPQQGISPWWQNKIKMNTDGLNLGEADEDEKEDADKVENEDGVKEVAICPHCGEGFANESALQEHIDKTETFKRGGCNWLWKKQNKEDVLAGKKRHVCEICELGFDSVFMLRQHLHSHGKSKDFKCPECGRTYKHESSLIHHLKYYHSNDTQFACPECKKTFRDKFTMRKHLKTVCSPEVREYKYEVNEVAVCICPHCGQGFDNENALQEHIGKHGGCDVLRKSKNKEKPHICEICGLGFDSYSGLREHRHTHSNSRDFKCEECGKVYKSAKTLRRHLKYYHSSEKTFACPVCKKAFSWKPDMKRHLRTVCNPEVKKHACDRCSKRFADNASLIEHVKSVHNPEHPFKCHKCNYTFSFKSRLLTHMKAYHEDNRPHQCKDCGAAFKTLKNLNHHRIRMHTFDWPHNCEVCGEQGIKKGFVHPNHLKKHMVTHHPKEYQDQLETEMPAVCDKCNKRFSTVQQLNNHYRKVHGLWI